MIVTQSPHRVSTALILALLFALCGSASAQDAARAAEFEPAPIDVPNDFIVEVAAAPPLVKHPMMADFDPKGRLYVAASAGKNLKRKALQKQKPNLIRRLEDTDGDGVFDTSTVFADGMTFPMGALFHDGALYVASPPNIWRLEDTDDDGVADKREIVVGEFGYTGNAASIHGCFLHPDGRIYWCDGRHGFDFPDGRTGKAAGIFSARPDGSDVRILAHGGMDNPVELVFTPRGETLGTTNLMYANPRGDTLTHWVRGGVYPRHDFVQKFDEFRRTGDLMEPITNFGHVAVSGLTRYRGRHLGEKYRGNLFITQFNTHKVVRSVLHRDGSTFTATTRPFLSSPDHDVHFTDVLEDADGSLLVIDTGGWFRIGCPESQTAKPGIRGAIYRIRRKGGERPTDPRGRNIAWPHVPASRFVELLDDPRPAVRDRAITALANCGPVAINASKRALNDGNKTVRRNTVWALHRIGTEDARDLIRKALRDDEAASVRQAAAHCVGMAEDRDALPPLRSILSDASAPAPLRREAATALGRIGEPGAVGTLLEALGRSPVDRTLEHALIYALIEIDAPDPTARGLEHDHPRARRGALIALDQMAGGELTAEQVTPLLGSSSTRLQQAAMDVIRKRPTWSRRIVDRLRGWLGEGALPEAQAGMLRGALRAFGDDEAIQKLVAETLNDQDTPSALRTLLLEAMAVSELAEAPEPWVEPLGKHLVAEHDPAVRESAVEAIGALGVQEFDERLMALATDKEEPDSLRLMALEAAVPRADQLPGKAFSFLIEHLGKQTTRSQRLTAARVLGAAALNESQKRRLADRLAEAGPVVLPELLNAFESGGSVSVGKALFAALKKSPALATLPDERLKRIAKQYLPETHEAARSTLHRLRAQQRKRSDRLAELEPALTGGDPSDGAAVFQKATCVACHTVDGTGGDIGPDLSTIGASRSRRDLLEAIVLPSASFARGYQPMTVETKQGETHFGRIKRETEKTVTLIDPRGTKHRFQRERIREIKPSSTSLMPQGLDRLMSEQELADLLAYLKSLK